MQTSTESKTDLWILSKLSNVVETVNKSFENYEFATATQSCYAFWLYDLCDNYLECLKPVFTSDDNDRKAVSRRVLYTCLDYGLRLLSPFMPFITEELFQRLPRKNVEIPSICVAPFPSKILIIIVMDIFLIVFILQLLKSLISRTRTSRKTLNSSRK